MLQSLYKCQRNLCTKIRKTSLSVQFVSTSCGSNIPTDENKSLINLCQGKSHGLSKEPIISEAKVLQLDTVKCSKVSAVIEFFRNHGFSANQMKKLIRLRPKLLASKVEKTLKPKLKYLQSIGFSEDECSKILCINPNILLSSIEKQLAPSFDSLKIFMGSELQAMAAIKRSPQIFNNKIAHTLKQTVQVLHQIGIPDSQVLEFIQKSPIILTINPKKMSKVGLRLKEIGFNVTSPAFRAAFSAMSVLSHSKMERKLETYRSMGFSDGEILNIFRLQPTCMFYSEDNIRAIVAFYVDKLHLSRSHLSQRPVFLLRSLERRVIPRCSVMQVLWSRGIISKMGKLSSILMISEKDFLEKYVTKYEAEVPELLAAYRGELMFEEYSFHLREVRQISMSKGSSPETKAA
ncbi:transcription termination factor MTERF2, chloroplastic-like [Lycium barbarum]|uniref:transcription termination factor MTERF2, chloroplastic-like n=1 Tax=Lycium barbarum TaxID=112863 RepID=UPI00293EB7FF|nr:transcription termination factor MTERF2, chloroplastic-like [Lycium barbarum]